MLIGFSRQYRLMSNTTESKAITFHPGAIRSGVPGEAVGQRSKGGGGDVQVEAKTADTMPTLFGGSHSGVYDVASELDAQDGAIN